MDNIGLTYLASAEFIVFRNVETCSVNKTLCVIKEKDAVFALLITFARRYVAEYLSRPIHVSLFCLREDRLSGNLYTRVCFRRLPKLLFGGIL